MTLARELEDLETRRKAGTLSEADAALAKHALLSGASAPANGPVASNTEPRRGPSGLTALLLSNLMFTLVILAALAAMVYVFVPMTLALPIMIVLALCLPFIWLWEWFTDLF